MIPIGVADVPLATAVVAPVSFATHASTVSISGAKIVPPLQRTEPIHRRAPPRQQRCRPIYGVRLVINTRQRVCTTDQVRRRRMGYNRRVATELTIPVNGVVLSAEEAGAGPPVVLLHGLTATRRYVVMGSRSLERSGHRVISYDARGHGRSSPAGAPGAYQYRDLVGDLEAVLDHLGLERAVLAGASMGAHTALAFTLRAARTGRRVGCHNARV